MQTTVERGKERGRWRDSERKDRLQGELVEAADAAAPSPKSPPQPPYLCASFDDLRYRAGPLFVGSGRPPIIL